MSVIISKYVEDKSLDTLVKSFLDIIVLAMLNGKPVHGYKIIADLHKTFGVLLSPGTLYPLLYHLENDKLIEVKEIKRRKLYTLTTRGRKKVSRINELYRKNSDKIFKFIDRNLLNSFENLEVFNEEK